MAGIFSHFLYFLIWKFEMNRKVIKSKSSPRSSLVLFTQFTDCYHFITPALFFIDTHVKVFLEPFEKKWQTSYSLIPYPFNMYLCISYKQGCCLTEYNHQNNDTNIDPMLQFPRPHSNVLHCPKFMLYRSSTIVISL